MSSLNKHINFFCGRGLEDIIHFATLPWFLSLISHIIDDTWSKSIFYFGIACCIFNLGKLIGYICGGILHYQRPRYPLIFIALGFIGMSLSKRMSIILLCTLFIGFGGAVMGSKGTHQHQHTLANLDASGQLM